MRWFERPEIEPLTRLWCNSTEESVNTLDTQYKSMTSLLQATSRQGAENLFSTLQSYLQFIYQQDPDFGHTEYLLLKPTDLERLVSLPTYKSDWLALEKRGDAEKIRKALGDWTSIMRGLTI
jgi:hypothetical protein